MRQGLLVALATLLTPVGMLLTPPDSPEVFVSYRVEIKNPKNDSAPDEESLRSIISDALGTGWGVSPSGAEPFVREVTPPASGDEGASYPQPKTAASLWGGVQRLVSSGAFHVVSPVVRNGEFPPQPGPGRRTLGECLPARNSSQPVSAADPALSDSTWHLGPNGANVFEAWKRSTGVGVAIAHPDTGYLPHPSIVAALLGRGFDFTSRTNDAIDEAESGVLQWPGHGTRTGSVIAGRPYELTEHWISGVAPAAQLMPLRVAHRVVLLDRVDYDVDQVAIAIRAAAIGDPNFVRRKADIISISLGGPSFKKGLKEALAVAEENNVIVIAAAGNMVPRREVVFPARFPNVIAVAASTFESKNWDGSSRGRSIAFAAPGHNVWTAKRRVDDGQEFDCIEPSSGTSYAVATSAGVAALWLSAHRAELDARPDIDRPKLFRALARCTARPMDLPESERPSYGGGILNAAALLAEPLPTRDGPAQGQSKRCVNELRGVPPRLASAG